MSGLGFFFKTGFFEPWAVCVNNLPKVASQWNSGATRESNPGPRAGIPSALTTRPLSHTTSLLLLLLLLLHCVSKNAPTLKRRSSELYGLIVITFSRNVQDSRIEFACFSFNVDLLFY